MTTIGTVTVIDHPLIQHKLTLMREKERSTNSFRELLGEHPIPTVRSWLEARTLIEQMLGKPGEIDALQERCLSWWDDYKQSYREQVIEFVSRRAADPEPVKEPIMGKAYSIPGWRAVELLRHHDANAVMRRVQKQVTRVLRQGKLRVAHRPGAK